MAGTMWDCGYELLKINLPRTRVNKGKNKHGSSDPYSAGRYLHRQGHIHLVSQYLVVAFARAYIGQIPACSGKGRFKREESANECNYAAKTRISCTRGARRARRKRPRLRESHTRIRGEPLRG